MLDRIQLSGLPGFSSVYLDYITGTLSARSLFPYRPSEEALIASASLALDRTIDRDRIADLLDAQSRPLNCSSASLDNIRKLRRPGSVAIVASQECRLLGGTLAEFLKILTVLKLASALEDRGIPAIPILIFRADTEPIGPIRYGTFDGLSEVLEIGEGRAERRPTSSDPITGDQSQLLLSKLAQGNSDAAQLARESFAPGLTWLAACIRFLASLTRDWGLVILNTVNSDLEGRAETIGAGLKAQLAAQPELLSHHQVRLQQSGYSLNRADSGTLAADATGLDVKLEGKLFKSLQNILLNYDLFPVAAQVLGPGEVEGLVSVVPLLTANHPSTTLVWPSVSASLVDGRSRKLLDRFPIGLMDLFEGPDAALRALRIGASAETARNQLDALLGTVEGGLHELHDALPEEDAELRVTIAEARARMTYQLGKLKERHTASHALRIEAIRRQLARLCRTLAPEGMRQEEYFAGFHFLSNYSLGILKRILDSIDPLDCAHQVIPVD